MKQNKRTHLKLLPCATTLINLRFLNKQFMLYTVASPRNHEGKEKNKYI